RAVRSRPPRAGRAVRPVRATRRDRVLPRERTPRTGGSGARCAPRLARARRMKRPFRFSVSRGDAASATVLGESARRAESLGYSTFVLSDHLLKLLAPNVALAVVAAATKTLRIGHFVLNNDLRHPAVLHQELASLDVLSEGRLEIGIGAGWNEPEYKAGGIPFDPVPTRVSRLEESIAVLKGLFREE